AGAPKDLNANPPQNFNDNLLLYLNLLSNSSFHRRLSIVQTIFPFRPRATCSPQTSRFLSSPATFNRSTTVIPRVNSLSASTSQKCSDADVTIDASSATAIATGSGSDIPCSPVCTWNASCARLLHSTANFPTAVP